MKTTARIVIDADPEVKAMVEEIKQKSGQSVKQIVENLIREAYDQMKRGG
ncbi:hypothetical protein [Ammoniphilus sp. 3BR4]